MKIFAHLIVRVMTASVVLAIVWSLGFVWFVGTLEQTAKDSHTVTDGIVVLTGGRGRVEMGLNILDQKLGRQLFISGVYKGVDAKILLTKQNIPLTLHPHLKNGQLGYQAHNTVQNAQETAEWIKANHIKSIRLVTADYHVKRSLLEFKQLLPQVMVIAHPVKTTEQLNGPALHKLWGEYVKLCVRYVRVKLGAQYAF